MIGYAEKIYVAERQVAKRTNATWRFLLYGGIKK